MHTETSTENGTTTDQHASPSGKSVDERAGDGDDGANEQADPATPSVTDPRCDRWRNDLG
jgi:hypothetical protein